jgi:transcription elongation factor GreA
MTRQMRRSLEARLNDLESRIEVLDAQRKGDDSLEATAMLVQLSGERDRIADALRDATLIDDEPFDVHAIEVGDVVTLRDEDGATDRYVLVDDGVGARARNDWVSVGSPLGAAVVGRSKGERVEVVLPQGTASYEILGFQRASDASDLPSEAFLG